MRQRTWACMGLWVAAACIAFAVGTRTGKISESERDREQHPEKIHVENSQPRRILADAARPDDLHTALADREERIRELEAELEEVLAKLPPPLSPEEEKRKKEQDERRKLNERRRARYEKSKRLRDKILQRKDKALRAQGLEELAALLQSDDPEKALLGLTTVLSGCSISFFSQDTID